MSEYRLTNTQARRFLLDWQGLAGPWKFRGKEGALRYIRQAGCVQFDPVDVCGKNAELVLQSRVKGFRKEQLSELLYRDRTLVDYFDKNLAIFPMEDWPCFSRFRSAHAAGERSRDEILPVCERVKEEIRRRGPLSSADLDMREKVDWYWSRTRVSRAALEHLYFAGELAVHHKNGAQKVYDLAENCIPPQLLHAPDPFPGENGQYAWRTLRRIGAVGLLWNKPSDAWLGIDGMKSPARDTAFQTLLTERRILPVQVEGVKETLYCAAESEPLLQSLPKTPRRARCILLGPLDGFLWDRRLIETLFGFRYRWEIYTPAEKREFAHYTLPLLYGERFAGRVEAVCDRPRGALCVRRIWLEESFSPSPAFRSALEACFEAFAAFNDCASLRIEADPFG